MSQVNSLGHVVGGGIVRPQSAKVEAVQRFPRPTTKTESPIISRPHWLLSQVYPRLGHDCCSTLRPIEKEQPRFPLDRRM